MNHERSLVLRNLGETGYACLSPAEAAAALQLDLAGLEALRASWQRLPRDSYLRDACDYRARRHSCYVQMLEGSLAEAAHLARWQPTSYNELHGGLTRWFEPIEAAVRASVAWTHLIAALGTLFSAARAVPRWYIEAHQFRIDTHQGLGRPTPEGAHRDGVDFVAVILVGRHHIIGGETRVFDAHGPAGVRFNLADPWSMLLMDDARVIHETTPIQADGAGGARDTLVLTYRAAGFQAPQ
jgi:hypothetical protein